MAAAVVSIGSSAVASAIGTSFPKKLLSISSSVSIPTSPTRRKNYLRRKLLKTLTKHYPTPLLPQESPKNLTLLTDSEDQQTALEQIPGDGELIDEGSGDGGGVAIQLEQEKAMVACGNAGIADVIGEGFSSGLMLKLVLWVVGVCVFQAVSAVFLLGPVNFDEKDGSLEGEKGIKKMKNPYGGIRRLFSGNVEVKQGGGVYNMDESVSVENISRIRAMAREVREKEAKNEQDYDDMIDDLENVEVSKILDGIGKEVDERFIKLQKRVNAAKSQNGGDRKMMDSGEMNGLELMFEKKHRFRSPLIEPSCKPVGFQKLDDSKLSDRPPSNSVNGGKRFPVSNEEESNGKLLKEDPEAVHNETGKLHCDGENIDVVKGKELHNTKSTVGDSQETRHGKFSTKGGKSKSSRQGKIHSAESVTEDNEGNIKFSNKSAGFGTNSRTKGKGVRSKSSNRKFMDKKSDIMAASWWLKLPYVLAIYMRRGSNTEGEGLFTLKISSSTYKSDSSHAVMFEDHHDATNFCYVLEAFFEDLGDFGADVIPLSIKELNEALKTQSLRVLVVKKGQIQLYAGQPLAEVEMALRSLIELDHDVDSSRSK